MILKNVRFSARTKSAASFVLAALAALIVSACGSRTSVIPVPMATTGMRSKQNCQAVLSSRHFIDSLRHVQTVSCDVNGGFGEPGNAADPVAGIFRDPGFGAPPPPFQYPGNPIPGNAQPFVGGPIPGEWDPLWIFSDLNISFLVGPAYNHVGTVAAGNITDVSIGMSTAGSPLLNPIPTSGHLYVQIWSYGEPIGAPLQAGSINGKLRGAKFSQDVIGQPHIYIEGTSIYRSTLAANLARHVANYAANTACSPAYTVMMSSNAWVDGLLLASGMSQDAINRYVIALQEQSNLIAYGLPNGSQIVNCF